MVERPLEAEPWAWVSLLPVGGLVLAEERAAVQPSFREVVVAVAAFLFLQVVVAVAASLFLQGEVVLSWQEVVEVEPAS